jgi:transposase
VNKRESLTKRTRRIVEEVAAHTADAKALRRAQALLWRDEGESTREVAERLGVSQRTIFNWSARFAERQGLEIPRRLEDGPRSGRPRSAWEIIDPLLDQLIDQDPREAGYRATVWTAPLLRQHLEAEHGVKVSRQSVSLALTRLRIRWKRPRHQLALRSPTWRQAKGGSGGGWRGGTAR